jgi:hypothetical protein
MLSISGTRKQAQDRVDEWMRERGFLATKVSCGHIIETLGPDFEAVNL